MEHVRQGGRLGRGPLRPPVVKQAWYLIQTVRIDGADCREAEVLERLVAWLDAHVQLDRLDMEWQAVLPVPTGSAAQRATGLRRCPGLVDGGAGAAGQASGSRRCRGQRPRSVHP